MKRTLLFFLFAFQLHSSFAQITVTAATFPAVKDTLRYATDNKPVASLADVITAPGGPQTWDLTKVNPGAPFVIRYFAASAGANASKYTGAKLVVLGLTNETYYTSSTTRFDNLGYAGQDPFGLNLKIAAKNQPALPERRAPMRFFDINNVTSNLSQSISIKDLPAAIKSSVPGINFADSIRVRVNTQRNDVVDGFGTIKIPAGQYAVLREKRTEYTRIALDARTVLGWIEVPTSAITIPEVVAALKPDTTTTYHFFNDKEKEEIAIVTLSKDLTKVRSVQVKAKKVTTSDNTEKAVNFSVIAFPNPAYESVSFDCRNLPSDQYTFQLYNNIGQLVWYETQSISGNKILRVPLDHLDKGTYSYRINNKSGEVIAAQLLLVVKP